MQLLFDFFPIVAFFIAYWVGGIYVATQVIIIAAFAQISIHWFRTRTFNKMHLVSAGLLVFFGGLTLMLKDEKFIQWKTTVLYALFSLIFLGSQFIGKKSIAERIMGSAIELPGNDWKTLNLMYVGFFALLGVLNTYVILNYSLDTWVNFKLFGALGLTFVFVIVQALWVARRMPQDENEK